jgi:hypothetical protein
MPFELVRRYEAHHAQRSLTNGFVIRQEPPDGLEFPCDGRLRARTSLDRAHELPNAREVMVVVFGDKIQMIDEPHWRLQTRVR